MFASEACMLLLTDKKDILDCGATDVFVKSTTRVESFEKDHETMSTAKSGSSLDIIGRGKTANGYLPVTVCDQHLNRNLIGLAPICDLDYTFIFNRNKSMMSDDLNEGRILEFNRRGNLYPCDLHEVADFIAARPPRRIPKKTPPMGGLHGKALRAKIAEQMTKVDAEEEMSKFDFDATHDQRA